MARPLANEYYHEVLENDWGVFFWRPPGFLGNWTESRFEFKGFKYVNAEQAIMHQKALLFNDAEVAQKILGTDSPRTHRQLGRQVAGFVEEVWTATIPDLLFEILCAKFSQTPGFGQALVATGQKLLYEATPLDFIWGTGVDPKTSVNSSPEDAKEWPGGNLLGQTLMRVRDALANAK